MIWKQTITTAQLNQMIAKTHPGHLGIEILSLDNDALTARMPVDDRTKQPFGLLHGGASASLIETLGSLAGNLCVSDSSKETVVGIEINANHLKAVRSGWVIGEAKAVRVGRKIQVWSVEIRNEKEEIICIGRLTLAVVPLSQRTK